MLLLRRIAGFLGFAKDDAHDVKDQDDDTVNDSQPRLPHEFHETGLPRKGFGVKVQVAVDRPQSAPLLLPSTSGDGGVQGLRWYAKCLRIDDDGDVADEFLDEVLTETTHNVEEQPKHHPRFEVKRRTRPIKVKNQVLSVDGKIQQCIEHQGRLQWV
ncbi:hypothetical protein HS088_TW16G00727 [Tripterygium wilfordii]|uniref:Uncharacterized protein n=1 Tax=Tripterygium wilfordii TaxID=458696 RepID=A0A7J7CJP3_TRIWF|nr:uncharacterized protein LOC119981361 [Tripterygium wilfordii]KAF5734280.1 hypothetical protein HS088_TW16G00727 [Tripterygium wilfordii]